MILPFSDPLSRRTGAAFFINGATFGTWATQIPALKSRLDLTPAQLGLMLLCLGIGAVAAMSQSGRLMQRFGSATVVRWAGVLFCALLPLVAIARPAGLEAVLVACFGAAGGTMDVAMNAHGSVVEQRAGRPQMSSYHGMFSLGGLVGAGVGGLLIAHLGGPLQAVLAGLVLLSLLVLTWPAPLPAEAAPQPSGHRGGLDLSRGVLLLGIMMGLAFATEGVVLDWSALFLGVDLQASQDLAGIGFAAFSGAMALMRFLGDGIRARLGGAALVRAGAILALIGVLLGPLTHSTWAAILGFAAAGVGLSNIVPVFFSAAGRLPHPEAAIATASMLGYAGLLVAPPTLGFIANETAIGGVFVTAAVMALVIALGAGLAGANKASEGSVREPA